MFRRDWNIHVFLISFFDYFSRNSLSFSLLKSTFRRVNKFAFQQWLNWFCHVRFSFTNCYCYLIITDFPEVECHDNDADYQEKKTHIRCIVRASPKLRWAEYHYNETRASGQNLTYKIKPGESAGQIYFRVEEGVCFICMDTYANS